MRKLTQTIVATALALAFAVPATAATISWDGEIGTDFNVGANWVGDSMPAIYLPADTGSGDVALLDASLVGLGNQTPTMSADYTLRGLVMEGSGWTLDTNGNTLRVSYRDGLKSNNTSGTNTINGTLRLGGNNTNTHPAITVAAGGTLRLNANIGIFADRPSGGNQSAALEKRGGGTLELNTTNVWGTSGLRVYDGTVRFIKETAGGITGNGTGGLGTANNRNLALNGGLTDINGTVSQLKIRTLSIAETAELTNSQASNVIVNAKAGGGSTLAGKISGDISLQLFANQSATMTITSANNSYTGTTQIGRSGGSGTNSVVVKTDALVNQDGAFGNASSAIIMGGLGNGGHAQLLSDGTIEIARDLTILSDKSTSNKVVGARNAQVGTSVFSGTVTVGNGEHADLHVTAGATGQADFTGNIVESANAGSGSVTKIGDGVVRFTGDNTYEGGTTITAGTLLIDNTTGSGTGTGAVGVDAGTLGGVGSASGVVTLGDGSGDDDAVLKPGNSIGTITLGGLTTAADALIEIELNSDTSATDQIIVNGDVTLGSGIASLSVTDSGSTELLAGTVLTLISNTSGTTSGYFADLTDGSELIVGVNTFLIDYDGGAGNDVTLTIIPEPASMLLLGAGGLLMFRRNHQA